MYDPVFDPVERLAAIGVRVVRRTLSEHDAIWIPHQRAVVVDRRLVPCRFRAVLAHEYVHALHDDPGGHNPKHEARANLTSALMLIDANQWVDLTDIHTDYDHVCIELGITREQFMAYYRHNLGRAA